MRWPEKTAIHILDVASGETILALKPQTRVFKGGAPGTYHIAISADGSRIASGNPNGSLSVWDTATGQALASFRGHTGEITSVSFSPDSSKLAAADQGTLRREYGPDIVSVRTVEPGSVKVWNAISGQQLLRIEGLRGMTRSVAFSPNGDRIVTAGSGGDVAVWDALDGHRILNLRGHSEVATCAIFSPDARRIASASWDQTFAYWTLRARFAAARRT